MTTRWKITVEYDGTPYAGWQKQNNEKTVQGELERAIKAFTEQDVSIQGSGRTDAGVHAYGQVVHFDLEKEFDPRTVMRAINAHLRKELICVLKAEKVAPDFSARFHATLRSYQYKILVRYSGLSSLDKNRVWCTNTDLDVDKMREASKYLLGLHDFTSFRSAECQAKSPIRSIEKIDFKVENRNNGDKEITMFIEARSFLHHQVRNIMGSLKFVGEGKWEPIRMKEVLEAKDRTLAGPKAPAQGLYFDFVRYKADTLDAADEAESESA